MSADYWAAFEYEVQMFHETRARLSAYDNEPTVRNALIESFLLHTRILIDALLDRGGESDDINLGTLLKAVPAPTTLSESAKALKVAYGSRSEKDTPCWTLNKRLAHLTNLRGDSFDYLRLYAVLDPLVRTMLHGVAHRQVLCH